MTAATMGPPPPSSFRFATALEMYAEGFRTLAPLLSISCRMAVAAAPPTEESADFALSSSWLPHLPSSASPAALMEPPPPPPW